MTSAEQEYHDTNLFRVFYATTRRLPQEVIEWSQSPEGKKALEDWEADYHAACARWGEEDAEAEAANAAKPGWPEWVKEEEANAAKPGL
jgi:hypothetical protein